MINEKRDFFGIVYIFQAQIFCGLKTNHNVELSVISSCYTLIGHLTLHFQNGVYFTGTTILFYVEPGPVLGRMHVHLAWDGRRFDPRVRQHSFLETGHEIISTAILSLPLIQVAVSYWQKDVYLVVVNRLGSLPRNSVVRLTDRLDMTIVVDCDVKQQIKQTKTVVQCCRPIRRT